MRINILWSKPIKTNILNILFAQMIKSEIIFLLVTQKKKLKVRIFERKPCTLKRKTRKKNKFRSSTGMVLRMFFFWNQKCFFFRKNMICAWIVTFLTLFRYCTWFRTKKRTLFLRVYRYISRKFFIFRKFHYAQFFFW
jgi:hypothetical protein